MDGTITAFIVGAAVLGWLAVYARLTKRAASESRSDERVLVRDIPEVYRALRTQGQAGSFAVFLLPPTDGLGSEDAANLQFSIEDGRTGVDWVLNSRQNEEDQGRFSAVAEELGYAVERRENNGVFYLRVTGGDLPRLARAALQRLYGMHGGDELGLITEGFTWRTSDASGRRT